MELRGVEIVFMQGGTERHDIVGHGYGVRVDRHVIAVYEINEFVRAEALEQRAACMCQGVPSHVGHFVFVLFRTKLQDFRVENA